MNCTRKLVETITASEEYQNFSKIRDQVREDPELRKRINEFRLLVFETQNTRQPLDMYEEQERICREYEKFRKEPLVEDFLQSELQICRIMQKVAAELTQGLDMDLDEVTERLTL